MHPTANSAAFIRKTPCLIPWMRGGWCGALDRYSAPCTSQTSLRLSAHAAWLR